MTDFLIVKNFLDVDDLQDILNIVDKNINSKNKRAKTEPWTAGSVTGSSFIELDKYLKKYTSKVSGIINQDIIPTYNFWRKSLRGTDLPFHIDRPACEVTVSINLKTDNDDVWPFYLNYNNPKTILLNSNDAVIYNGFKHIHWREPLEVDYNYQLCLHYVLSDGLFKGIHSSSNWTDVDCNNPEIVNVKLLHKQVNKLNEI